MTTVVLSKVKVNTSFMLDFTEKYLYKLVSLLAKQPACTALKSRCQHSDSRISRDQGIMGNDELGKAEEK